MPHVSGFSNQCWVLKGNQDGSQHWTHVGKAGVLKRIGRLAQPWSMAALTIKGVKMKNTFTDWGHDTCPHSPIRVVSGGHMSFEMCVTDTVFLTPFTPLCCHYRLFERGFMSASCLFESEKCMCCYYWIASFLAIELALLWKYTNYIRGIGCYIFFTPSALNLLWTAPADSFAAHLLVVIALVFEFVHCLAFNCNYSSCPAPLLCQQ